MRAGPARALTRGDRQLWARKPEIPAKQQHTRRCGILTTPACHRTKGMPKPERTSAAVANCATSVPTLRIARQGDAADGRMSDQREREPRSLQSSQLLKKISPVCRPGVAAVSAARKTAGYGCKDIRHHCNATPLVIATRHGNTLGAKPGTVNGQDPARNVTAQVCLPLPGSTHEQTSGTSCGTRRVHTQARSA